MEDSWCISGCWLKLLGPYQALRTRQFTGKGPLFRGCEVTPPYASWQQLGVWQDPEGEKCLLGLRVIQEGFLEEEEGWALPGTWS